MWSLIRPHIVFTYGRQQQQPNHNTTTYCGYLRTTKTKVITQKVLCLETDNDDDDGPVA
jgi:hypothetical protein